jgi:outer membrane protein OmpA-like peptidoglycan-associated protein
VETERVARDTEARTTAAALDAERRQRASDARVAFAQAESERLQRQNEASSAAAQVEANRLRQANDAERALTEGKLDQAAAEMAQAQAEKIRLRGQLLEQFNAILQTRDSARGLIVNISDVLFDTAKFSLRPQAREKLARVAGILAGHPGLQLQVEGFTDSVGTEVYNQQLSENRAASVRQYLTESGLPATSVTAKGFGKLQPVATNDTSAGRQLNRRVELVVSGEIIGGDVQTAPAASPRPLPNNQ